MGADARDYDNDGWPDIFYNNLPARSGRCSAISAAGLFAIVSGTPGSIDAERAVRRLERRLHRLQQ